jgi:hypothetical protein
VDNYSYAFTDDTPTIIATGETRYTPTGAFYLSRCNLTTKLGYRNTDGAGAYINTMLDYAVKVAPWNIENYSFGFSVLRDYDLKEYLLTYTLKATTGRPVRLLDPNVLSHEFTFDLPSNEIYLNEATTVAGSLTKGFRLQNDI